jgi:hypothetical protein
MEDDAPGIDLSTYTDDIPFIGALEPFHLADFRAWDASLRVGDDLLVVSDDLPPDGDYPPADLDPDLSHDYSTGLPPRKRSQHEQWCEKLLNMGAAEYHDLDGIKNFTIVYVDIVPPLLPQPRGPSPGADATMVFAVPGQDLRFTFGNAVSDGRLLHPGNVDAISVIMFDISDVASRDSLSRAFMSCRLDEVHLRFTSRNREEPRAHLAVAGLIDRHATEVARPIDFVGQPNVVLISSFESFDLVIRPRLPDSAVSYTSVEYWEDQDRWVDINHVKPHFGVQIAMLAPAFGSRPDVHVVPTDYSWDISARYKVSFLSHPRVRSPPPDLDD